MRRIGKILTSRLAAFGFVVLCELGLLLTLLLRLSSFSVYFLVFLLAINLLSMIVVVNSDANPEYKLTWLSVIVLIPYLGTALYFLYGKSTPTVRERRIIEDVRENIQNTKRTSFSFFLPDGLSIAAGGKPTSIVSAAENAEVYSGTQAEYFASGAQMYDRMLSDLKSAEKYIFLEYFIIRPGQMWQGILDILKEKARTGIEVRVMYDDVGCMTSLPLNYDKELMAAGISAIRFSKITPSLRYMRRNNSRDHRKLMIIDGKVAYTGGVNIGDEYIGLDMRYGLWRDSGIRLLGKAAEGFAALFLEQWGISSGHIEAVGNYFGTGDGVRGDGGYYLPFGSGPCPVYKSSVGKRAIIDIINSAKRYVYIFTPYLIIDFDLTEALLGAALRGVDIRIITPGVPDKPIVRLLTRGSYPTLLSGGIKIFEYTPGFLHAKSLVADDTYAIVGTINLDYRSLVHHYENAVWIYSSPVVSDIKNDFLSVMQSSERVTPEKTRAHAPGIIFRSLLRLFAPLF